MKKILKVIINILIILIGLYIMIKYYINPFTYLLGLFIMLIGIGAICIIISNNKNRRG